MKKHCVDCNKEFDDYGYSYRVRCFDCFKDNKLRNPFLKKTGVDALPEAWTQFLDEIPALLQLCHVDKHNNSPGSIRVTKWLLEVKDKHGKSKRKTG